MDGTFYITVSRLNFLSVIWNCDYREKTKCRGEMSQYLQLILKWFRKKKRDTWRVIKNSANC